MYVTISGGLSFLILVWIVSTLSAPSRGNKTLSVKLPASYTSDDAEFALFIDIDVTRLC